MIPLHLSVSGFLSYRDPVELDFTTFELACISGANGAGKSSLLDAITYALFGQARKRDDALVNTHSEAAEVTLTFAYEGNTYRVLRAKPREKTTVLEFHIRGAGDKWKALTERTMRDTDALIQETLRLDYETFVNASFFLQGKADQFTQQRPADRKRILGSILGLEIWETYRSAAFERRRKVEEEISGLDGRLQEINAELAEADERKARLKELNADLEQLAGARKALETALGEMRKRVASVEQQEELVKTLAGQLARVEAQLEDQHKRLDTRRADKAEYQDTLEKREEIEAGYSAWQKLREELREWEAVAAKFNEQEKQRTQPLTAIEAERARLETELEALKAERVKAEEAKTRESELKKELSAVQSALSDIEKQLQAREKLEKSLDEARQAHAKAEAENPHLKQEMDELKARINQIQNAKGAACPTCGQPLTEDHRREMVTLWTAEGKEKGDRYRNNQTTLKEAQLRVADLEKELSALAQADGDLRQQSRTSDQLSNRLEELEKLQALWTREKAPRMKELETRLKNEDFASEAREALAKIDAELKKIGYDAAKHDELRKQEEEARSAETNMRKLEQAQAALKPLEREIKDLEKQIEQTMKDFEQVSKAHTEAAAALAAAQSNLPDVTAAERDMLKAQEQENLRRQEVGAAQQRVAVLDELRERKQALVGDRESLAASVSHLQALERAFGKDGVPAMLIEQALPQIEAKANKVLERLSGGQMHVSFLTQQAYKDKTREDLRETLEIQISDSAGERDYEMFSGGEAFRINFAIRLALSEVLAQRAGARLQTLVIDEGFGSQDEAGRQRLVEAINLVKDDFEKILIITHIDALKDAFPARIEVEKTARGSVLQVI